MSADWKRLGARFGVPDLCVAFPEPATVYRVRGGAREPVAERVVALREGPEGVSVEVECGIVLHIAGACVGLVGPGEAEVEARVRTVPKR